MQTPRKHRLAAWLLLATWVPMLFVSMLHVHHAVETQADSCTACVHHVPHGAHLNTAQTAVGDCVLCQFASLPYLVAALLGFTLLVLQAPRPLQPRPCRLHAGVPCSHRGRAPPQCFLL